MEDVQKTLKDVTVERIAMTVNNNTRIAEAGRRVLAEIDKNPQLAEDLAALFGIKH